MVSFLTINIIQGGRGRISINRKTQRRLLCVQQNELIGVPSTLATFQEEKFLVSFQMIVISDKYGQRIIVNTFGNYWVLSLGNHNMYVCS